MKPFAQRFHKDFWARLIYHVTRATVAWGRRWSVQTSDLEDIAQDVVISLSRRPQLATWGEARLNRYCIVAVRRTGGKFLRRRMRRTMSALEDVNAAMPHGLSPEDADLVAVIRKALPEDDQVILDAYTRSASYRDAADAVGIPESTFRVRLAAILRRAHQLLR